MLAFKQPSYEVRRAHASEAGLVAYLRFASLLSLEMANHRLESIRTFMSMLPDVDSALVGSGRYFVADQGGDLIGGGGWSVLPLSFRSDRLSDERGRPTQLALGDDSVLVRGFFVDPDQGRRGAGAAVLAEIEADIRAAGHPAAELFASAASQVYYRGLGFKPVRGLALRVGAGEPLPLIQMRKPLAVPLALAA